MKLAERAAKVWNDFFFTGFSPDSLGLLRIYLGCGLLIFHVSQFVSLLTLNPLGPAFYFTKPMWHFELLGIHSHLPALTPILFLVLMLATLAMTLGRWTRPAILVMILCIFYLKGVRDSFAGDVHHRYLMPMQILFFLLLSRCGDVRTLGKRCRASVRPLAEWEASWPIKTMQLYISCFYFWGALAKWRASGMAWFFEGGRIQEILVERAIRWGGFETHEVLINPLSFEMAQSAWLMSALGIFTLIMEAGFPLILLVRSVRGRLLFLLAVAGFHLANFVLLRVMFLLIPIVFLVFFDLVPIHAWMKSRLVVARKIRSTLAE